MLEDVVWGRRERRNNRRSNINNTGGKKNRRIEERKNEIDDAEENMVIMRNLNGWVGNQKSEWKNTWKGGGGIKK